jgi:hypothetical protein
VAGTASHGELWGLLFGQPVTGREIKIVWRITGTADLSIEATGPRGEKARRTFFEPHGASNWSRPGDEWGSGWVFQVPGCWDVHLTRQDAEGHFYLMVG